LKALSHFTPFRTAHLQECTLKSYIVEAEKRPLFSLHDLSICLPRLLHMISYYTDVHPCIRHNSTIKITTHAKKARVVDSVMNSVFFHLFHSVFFASVICVPLPPSLHLFAIEETNADDNATVNKFIKGGFSGVFAEIGSA
jgi:hypothetical protein